MMKKILVLITTILISIQVFSKNEPYCKNEADYFEFFIKHYVSKQASTFQNDIKIELKGEFSKADSANMQKLITTLAPLIQRVNIYIVKNGGNIIFKIDNNGIKGFNKNTLPFEFSPDYEFFTQNIGKINNQYYSFNSIFKYGLKNDITKVSCSISFYPDCPQELRNKFITNYLIQNLIIVSRTIPSKIELKSTKNWGWVLPGDSTSTKSFNEIDKYIIYHAYLKWPTFHFLMQHLKQFLEFSSNYWGNYYYIIVYSLAFLLIIVYMIILFKFRGSSTAAPSMTKSPSANA